MNKYINRNGKHSDSYLHKMVFCSLLFERPCLRAYVCKKGVPYLHYVHTIEKMLLSNQQKKVHRHMIDK